MRKSEFRGFNRKNNRWLYGFYLQNRGAHFVCPDEFANAKTWDDYEIDVSTLGQFTNLYDANGKAIYEGDYVTILNEDDNETVGGEVVFSDSYNTFCFLGQQGDLFPLHYVRVVITGQPNYKQNK